MAGRGRHVEVDALLEEKCKRNLGNLRKSKKSKQLKLVFHKVIKILFLPYVCLLRSSSSGSNFWLGQVRLILSSS